ncbi:MAG: diguanylate cyclase [Thermodesulfobacteriota bacterium]
MRAETRTVDLAARYGGEEFVVILPSTDGREARFLAERIRKRFDCSC